MGLYDNWKLSNSTSIPQYEGSAGDDFIKVGQYKQGLYDQAQQADINLGRQANEVSSTFAQDQPVVDELRNQVQGKIKDITQRGDLENAMPEIQALGQHFANRQREILAPQQKAAEYRKSLDEKELNLTPEQKQGLYAMSVAGYKGLQKNARGQYVGSFSGEGAAKNIDVNKKVDEWVKDAVTHKYGQETETLSSDDGGMWIVKNGVKVDRLTPQQITGIVSNAAANDNEYQSFKNMSGKLNSFKVGHIYDHTDVADGPIKDAALQLAKSQGVQFKDAYKSLIEHETKKNIDDAALGYATGKYSKDDKSTISEIKANPYEEARQKHSLEQTAITPFISQGPDSKLTDDEKNYNVISKNTSKVKEDLGDARNSLSAIDKKLSGTLDAATRTQLQSEREALQKNIDGMTQKSNRNDEIMGYSKDLTAQHMGYDNYDSFLQKNGQGLKNTISKTFPAGLKIGDRTISVDELTEAAADNRIRKSIMIPRGAGADVKPITTGADITLKDGTRIHLTKEQKGAILGDSIDEQANTSSSKIKQFNDKLAEEHSANVKDFSVQGSNVSLGETDRKDIAAHIKSNMDGVRFSNPGQIDAVKAPDDFEVYTIGTTGLGNDAKIRVQGKDSDGKPTGKFYDVTMTNSNIAENISRKLAESTTPEGKMAADVLSANSGARQLYSTIPGNKVKVGQMRLDDSSNSDPVDVSIKVTRNRDKTISYNLIRDDNGTILKSSGSAATAGSWMDNLQGKDTYSNGRKTDSYNVKSRRPR